MAGLGLAGGYGAGAASATLGDILKQKFLEQIQKQKLAEDMRQANMQQQTVMRGQDLQRETNEEARKFREQTLAATIEDRKQQGIDRDLNREVQTQTVFQAGVPLRVKGSYVSPEEQVRFIKAGQTGATTAAGEDTHGRDPHFHFAGTAAQLQAEEKAKADAAEQTNTVRHQREMERLAGITANKPTAGANPQPQIFYDGNNKPHAVQFVGGQAREIPLSGDLMGKTQRIPGATAQQMMAGADASMHTLGKLEGMFEDVKGLIGPVAGRAYTLGQQVPGVPVNPKFAKFASENATLKNAIVKAITGAQMSEPEAKRIMTQIPDVTDKPEVWVEKAQATRDNLSFLRSRMADLSKPQADTTAPDTTAPTAPKTDITALRDKYKY